MTTTLENRVFYQYTPLRYTHKLCTVRYDAEGKAYHTREARLVPMTYPTALAQCNRLREMIDRVRGSVTEKSLTHAIPSG